MAQRSERVRRYIEEHQLPFDVLVDDSREILKKYGVWHRVGVDAWNISRPAVFLIDQAGLVRYVFIAAWQTEFPERATLMEEIRKLYLA